MKIENGRIIVAGRRYHIDVERVRREYEGAEVDAEVHRDRDAPGGADGPQQVDVYAGNGGFLSRATPMDTYTTGTGQRMSTHAPNDCTGRPCVIHAPSGHTMSAWPTHWRDDRGFMERICEHGVGHPDPDDRTYRANADLHGCDGCCR